MCDLVYKLLILMNSYKKSSRRNWILFGKSIDIILKL
jgi:hypothetical protein